MGLVPSKTKLELLIQGCGRPEGKRGEATLILEMERVLPENSTRDWPFGDRMTGEMAGLLILIRMKMGNGETGSSI